PWTLASFMSRLDDDRVVNDALLFGVRGTFRPPRTGLEIGISRTAQWCGDDRPCSAETFADLLLGRDNRGVNVDPQDEPGNQLAGFDIRWRLPKKLPVALYMQWIGEDGRASGLIGNWVRQLGIEHWGSLGGQAFRAHVEVSDTQARQGGFGLSDPRVNYTYNHYIYRTGYRYEQRSLGHGMDGDGLMYSLGSTLVGENGSTWDISLRSIEINRTGTPDPRHSLSRTPVDRIDALITHERTVRFGRIRAGIGFVRVDDSLSDGSTTDVTGFIRWSSN
ncbi:MAG: capsule assembly Wzi family protein, partial [Proteobacteria bacterium]|nr:capsule assembly Wzi family protein [Pseudomonadota bacterium]